MTLCPSGLYLIKLEYYCH